MQNPQWAFCLRLVSSQTGGRKKLWHSPYPPGPLVQTPYLVLTSDLSPQSFPIAWEKRDLGSERGGKLWVRGVVCTFAQETSDHLATSFCQRSVSAGTPHTDNGLYCWVTDCSSHLLSLSGSSQKWQTWATSSHIHFLSHQARSERQRPGQKTERHLQGNPATVIYLKLFSFPAWWIYLNSSSGVLRKYWLLIHFDIYDIEVPFQKSTTKIFLLCTQCSEFRS